MNISELAVKNRTTVFVITLIIIIAGLTSYSSLPREDEPDVKIPYVFISTAYKGVSPKDIETYITIPIEKKLKGLKNVKEVKSTSSEGLSSIAVEFITGTSIEDAKQWVKDRVDMAKRDLPTDLQDDPYVFEVNLSELPILTLSLTSTMSMREMKEIAKNLKDDIETIKGVLEVDLVGGVEREIHIEIDPDLLAIHGVPFAKLYSLVKSENQNVSGGSISMGDGKYQIRVPGEIKNIEKFRNLIVMMNGDNPIYLKDIATITDSYKDKTSISKFNYQNSINLYVKKRAGENIIRIVDDVKKLLKDKKDSLPQNLNITLIMDKSRKIRFMISDLENNIITGIILVVLVLMFAMGFRNAMLVGIAIPISILLSFSVLQYFNITLNMVTLFSLTLALGMLVDNAIVIVENIYRFTSQGVPKSEAAILASKEVALPVIASTATTVVAFYPMLYWGGIMGEFMKYLPITLITTLLSSLFVALVINPALCSLFIKAPESDIKLSGEDIIKLGEKPVQNSGIILRTYEKILRFSLKSRIAILVLSILFLFIVFNLWMIRVGITRPVEFMPSIEPDIAFINIDVPEGMDLDNIRRIEEEIEKRIRSYKNVPLKFQTESMKPSKLSRKVLERFEKYKKEEGIDKEKRVSDLRNIRFIYSKLTTKLGGQGSFGATQLPNHVGIQFHDFDGRVESSKVTLDKIRERLKGIVGAHIYISEQKHGPPTGSAINIEVSGDDFTILGKIAKKIKKVIAKIPHIRDIEDDYVKGAPTIELVVDRRKAAFYGVSTGEIGSLIKTAINGWIVSTYRENNDDYDIVIIAEKSVRKDMDIFNKLFMITQKYGLIPILDLVNIKYTGGLGMIRRVDFERVVTIKADVDSDKLPGAVAKKIAQKLLKNYKLPIGYKISFAGEDKFQRESQEFLSKAFVIALLLVFIVLVMQFNSLVHTMIIMFSVLLSIGGIFLGLFAANIPFGIIMTGIGVISLAGVVVNNAIVLLDYINQLQNRGYDLTEAIVEASKTRFRPVLLTAITTILGLIPMITGVSFDFLKLSISTSSWSAQFWYSMAIAVAFGLAVATLLTLVVVPVVYHLISDIISKMKKFIMRKKTHQDS